MLINWLKAIQKNIGAEFLTIALDEKYSSKQDNYRMHIRENIIEQFKNILSSHDIMNIKDLNQFPRSKIHHFSISHSQKWGGYSTSNLPHGFDTEMVDRIESRVAQRISTPQEISEAPSFEYVWVAKEAAVKSFLNRNLVITDIQIESWASHNETSGYCYRIKPSPTLELKRNSGYVLKVSDQIFSIFFP